MNFKALLKSLLLRKFTAGLLVLQLAITIGLLINSAILAFDTANKLNKDTGLDLENTLIVSLHPTSGNYRDFDYFRSIVNEDLQQLLNLQGVEHLSIVNQLPFRARGRMVNLFDLDNPEQENQDKYLKDVKLFFTQEDLALAMNLTLIEGRFLDSSDILDYGSDEVGSIVITESLRKTLYGENEALGQETNNGRVIGVVKDIILDPTLPDDKQYGMFVNIIMEYVFVARYYVLRVAPGQMTQVRNQVSDTILKVQAERDIFKVFTLKEHTKSFYQNDKGLSQLFLLLCGLMLLVTAISSYAYSQFHITRQKKYIGIRRALGARKVDILLYVLTETWLVYALGCLLGIVLTYVFNILLSQYISLSKPDVLLFAMVVSVIFISGTIATWIPAIKTSNIPPVIATRTV